MSQNPNQPTHQEPTPETCTHDCKTCAASCAERDPNALILPPNPQSRIARVIPVMSGKGGVGKSSMTACLASLMRKRGYKVGILDGDLTGPSIPQAFGLHEKATGTERGLIPEYTGDGIAVMSLNLLLNHETDPVIWRGSILASAVKQFWTDVIWGDLDYLFVDMPPGTGDVPLTVLQALPVTGILVVTSPQDLVSMIIQKAVKMVNMMEKPIFGLIENYSYFRCNNCGTEHHIFGESHLDAVAQELSLPVIARIPMDPAVAAAVDAGEIESLEANPLGAVADFLEGIS